MGQKVNPNGFRIGIYRETLSRWYSDKHDYGYKLVEDQKIYRYFEKKTRQHQIGKVEITRSKNWITVFIHTARIGMVLGPGGEGVKKIVEELRRVVKRKNQQFQIEVLDLKQPELSAKLLAEQIAEKLENRTPFRLAQRQVIRSAMRAGAKGIKTLVSGRLGGVDMARTEGYTEGEMKLHTLRQRVEYATALGKTSYGVLGVKVWVSLGEILRERGQKRQQTEEENLKVETKNSRTQEEAISSQEQKTKPPLKEQKAKPKAAQQEKTHEKKKTNLRVNKQENKEEKTDQTEEKLPENKQE